MKTFMEIVRKWKDAPDLTHDEKVQFIQEELEWAEDIDPLECMVLHNN